MTRLDWLLLTFGITATILHLSTVGLAMFRCRRQRWTVPAPNLAPGVTILRPICGLDEYDELTLRSSFTLDYPDFEVIFCCAHEADPAVRLVRGLIAEHPRVKARLLIGNNVISSNPKLNNLVKGWRTATNDWIIMADSNVLMPPDYIQRLVLGWRSGTGILCSPPIGCMGRGFERQEPRAVGRFERDFVVDRFAARLQIRRGQLPQERGRLPLAAVELRQHRAAEIEA